MRNVLDAAHAQALAPVPTLDGGIFDPPAYLAGFESSAYLVCGQGGATIRVEDTPLDTR